MESIVSVRGLPTTAGSAAASVFFLAAELAAWKLNGALFALPFVMVWAAWLAQASAEWLDAGYDGVCLRGWTRSDFIPLSDLARVEHHGGSIVMHRRNGASEKFLTVDANARELAERLSDRIANSARTLDEELIRELPQIAARREAHVESTPYRAPGVTAAQLWGVLENGVAPRHARVAAAISLGDLSGADVMRLKKIAARAIDGEVAILLRAVSSGNRAAPRAFMEKGFALDSQTRLRVADDLPSGDLEDTDDVEAPEQASPRESRSVAR